MSRHYLLRPRARTDLKAIWRHTEARWGRDKAKTYTNKIRQDMEALAAKPDIGRQCPEVRPGYYKFPSGSHFVFYRIADDHVEIVRILHERMDFDQHIP